MTDIYLWSCICGTSGRGEAAAQRHAKTCGDFGRPGTNPHVESCPVTDIPQGRHGGPSTHCGLPVVAHGLCERHYADRVRLGGTA